MNDYVKRITLLLEEILAFFVDDDTERELRSDIEFHTTSNGFFKKGTSYTSNWNFCIQRNCYTNVFKTKNQRTAGRAETR